MFKGSFLQVFKTALESYRANLSPEKQAELLELLETSPEKLINSVLKSYSKSLYDSMLAQIYPRTLEYRATDAEFMARMESKWGHCFVLLDSFYNIVCECGDIYHNIVHIDNAELFELIPNKVEAIFALHLRACQMFLEITCLCKNGFGDAAFSRWRSLYELNIIADRLFVEDDVISKAYLDSFGKSDTKYKWLRTSPNFSEEKSISFSLLAKRSKFSSNEWDQSYHLSNCYVHGSADGTLARLSMPEGVGCGKSDYGIDWPAIHASTTLLQLSSVLFSLVPTYDSVAMLSLLTDFNGKMIQDFDATVEKVFDEK